MKTFTANEAKTRFGEFIAAAGQAMAAGLTPARLDELLADES